MHASAIFALALGATVVSAEIVNGVDTQNFPKTLDCKGNANGPVTFTKAELVKIAVNADRSGPPRETSANNLATARCGGESFANIPLWITELPNQAGSLYYALNPKDNVFSFCLAMSGKEPSGWPAMCKMNY